MRLKKIAIQGFKSFADKASVEFGPGITAIVGPNGCGKSNIIDAFRWVMGEQSAKAIRGERMIDLIFSGTSGRKPLNVAEVSLIFCNEERKLPLDVSEIAVSRRIHRDGESLFFINKAAARLKDIETLFWD
ncbi:MAG: AAA family ATPase, partial [Chlamydiota bacterium]